MQKGRRPAAPPEKRSGKNTAALVLLGAIIVSIAGTAIGTLPGTKKKLPE
ncbi:hypothetical protein [Massilia horti]|nr:hypothetical protein [Massilia horti]